MEIRELLAKRATLWDKAQKFWEEHADKDSYMLESDATEFDKMINELEGMTRTIDAHKKLGSWDREMNKPFNAPIYEQPYNPFGNGETVKGGIGGNEYRKNFLNAVRSRFNPANNYLREGQLDDGGVLLPTEFNSEIVTKLQAENILRQIGKVITTASTMQFPLLAAQPAASWIGEGETIQFSNAAFGQVTLSAHKLGTSIVCSNEILQDSYYDLEKFLIDEFGRSLARAEEEAFLTGTGQDNQPLGLLPTLAQSASSTLQTNSGEITMDDLITLTFSVDRVYRRAASFLMSDVTLAKIRRLKDNTQNYLWQPSLIQGEPDKILGYNVYTSNYLPPAESGNVPILFGDFSAFVIGDRGNRQFRPLRELYALSDKTAFLMLERVDCILTDRHAIRGLKIR